MAARVLPRLGAMAGVLLLPACVTLAAPAERVASAPPPVDAGGVLKLVLGLVLVLLAIGASAWVLRHLLRFQPGMNGQLRILAGLPMGPREKVVLIKVGERQLLLGVAPGRIQLLHTLEEPLEEVPDHAHASSGFSAQLSRVLQKTGGRRHG